MTPHTYRYRADITGPSAPLPRTYFRGYVEHYDGAKRIRTASPLVREARSEAMRDARMIMRHAKTTR
jgi:hypothetical protein